MGVDRPGEEHGETEWPACQKCSHGTLIPLSDYGREGAPITYKAWVCTNPECGFNLRIDNGRSPSVERSAELQVGGKLSAMGDRASEVIAGPFRCTRAGSRRFRSPLTCRYPMLSRPHPRPIRRVGRKAAAAGIELATLMECAGPRPRRVLAERLRVPAPGASSSPLGRAQRRRRLGDGSRPPPARMFRCGSTAHPAPAPSFASGWPGWPGPKASAK